MLIDRTDKVEIYGQNGCSYCISSVNICQQNKVPYAYYEVSKDITTEEFKEMFPGCRTVPQIKINGTHIGGFKELEAEFRL